VIIRITDPVAVTTPKSNGKVAPIDYNPPLHIFIFPIATTKNIATPIPTNPKQKPPIKETTNSFTTTLRGYYDLI
jgi:hypothetical protein